MSVCKSVISFSYAIDSLLVGKGNFVSRRDILHNHLIYYACSDNIRDPLLVISELLEFISVDHSLLSVCKSVVCGSCCLNIRLVNNVDLGRIGKIVDKSLYIVNSGEVSE